MEIQSKMFALLVEREFFFTSMFNNLATMISRLMKRRRRQNRELQPSKRYCRKFSITFRLVFIARFGRKVFNKRNSGSRREFRFLIFSNFFSPLPRSGPEKNSLGLHGMENVNKDGRARAIVGFTAIPEPSHSSYLLFIQRKDEEKSEKNQFQRRGSEAVLDIRLIKKVKKTCSEDEH